MECLDIRLCIRCNDSTSVRRSIGSNTYGGRTPAIRCNHTDEDVRPHFQSAANRFDIPERWEDVHDDDDVHDGVDDDDGSEGNAAVG